LRREIEEAEEDLAEVQERKRKAYEDLEQMVKNNASKYREWEEETLLHDTQLHQATKDFDKLKNEQAKELQALETQKQELLKTLADLKDQIAQLQAQYQAA
jgi:chromosome segregation ATPase